MKRLLYIAIFSAAMLYAYATGITLAQNYPNPATEKTYITVDFKTPKATLTIYNVLGRTIEQRVLANSGTFEFDVSEYAEGVYLYTLEAGGEKITKRMTVVNK